ncbi:MAG: hypothetical protein R6W96_08630 [Clostridia bacterium]
MEIGMISHSGVCVMDEDTLFIFDYYRTRGFFPDFKMFRDIYVFASHRHHDHFNPEILQWGKDANVTCAPQGPSGAPTTWMPGAASPI